MAQAVADTATEQPAAKRTDSADWPQPTPSYPEFRRLSQYIAMSDGVRLAADIYLPSPAERGATFPSVLVLTPYFRSLQIVDPPRPAIVEPLQYDAGQWGPRLARHGIVVVVVEVRGAGASFGRRRIDQDPSGARDDVDLVDWMVGQPWSNGMVGATGISAPGLAALALLTAKHPAVRAVAPLWTAFDVFASTHPGGVVINAFVQANREGTRALDRNDVQTLFAGAPDEVRTAVVGLRPVDEDVDGSLLAAAVAEHAGNVYIHEGLLDITCRDDPFSYSETGTTTGTFSPADDLEALRASDAAIYSYAGWYDGAFTADMIDLFRAVGNESARLIVGPWGHGGHTYDSPLVPPGTPSDFDHASELAGFFLEHLSTVPSRADRPAVRYFTMGAERWRSAEVWPPPTVELPGHLAADGVLQLTGDRSLADHGADSLEVDFSLGSGPCGRYTNSAVSVDYGDRREADRQLLTYTSAPLASDTEVTGHPRLDLEVSSDREDFLVIAYLEDVAPDGTVRVVTEGVQRGIFRRVSAMEPPRPVVAPYRCYTRAECAPVPVGEVIALPFAMAPTSWVFRSGHRIRLAIAGADSDTFPRTPAEGPLTLTVHRHRGSLPALRLPALP